MSEQELNKKLAERYGFTYETVDPQDGGDTVEVCIYPDGTRTLGEPDFTHSLDACFKWLVPKVIKSANYSIIIIQNLAQCIAYVRPMQGGIQYEAVDNQNPALALCKVIDKLIDSEASDGRL